MVGQALLVQLISVKFLVVPVGNPHYRAVGPDTLNVDVVRTQVEFPDVVP